MLILYICNIFILLTVIDSTEIPFLSNVTLKGGYNSSSTLINNKTNNECLCLSSLMYPAVNWFSNNTCEIFFAFPPTYRLQVTPNARLYFPRKVFPDPSQCCMPNINYLLGKLTSTNVTWVNVTTPRDIIIDDNRYLVTVEMTNQYLSRFDSKNLTRISHKLMPANYLMTIDYTLSAYYIASNNNFFMTVIDSNNLTVLNNITLTGVNGPRDIMFLNNSQTMVITSNVNDSLVFFKRLNNTSTKYIFNYNLVVNYSGPHGFWRVNDSFFYVTSRGNNAIYSHSLINSTVGSWNQKLVFKVLAVTNTTAPSHVTLDECGRFWISLEISTALIYDQLGNLLGNFTIPNAQIFDIKIMNNYLMYFSDWNSNRIFRFEPNIQC